MHSVLEEKANLVEMILFMQGNIDWIRNDIAENKYTGEELEIAQAHIESKKEILVQMMHELE